MIIIKNTLTLFKLKCNSNEHKMYVNVTTLTDTKVFSDFFFFLESSHFNNKPDRHKTGTD